MKNFIKTLVILFVCSTAFGQTLKQQFPGTLPIHSIQSNKIDNAVVQHAKDQLTHGRNGRGIKNVIIDYDAVDEVSAVDSGGEYNRYFWELHSQFPDDSSYDYWNFNWVAVSFDTLVDATDLIDNPLNPPVPYPNSVSTVTIDSIVLFAWHENFTGTMDSIVISVLSYNTQAPSSTLINGLKTDGLQKNITNTILFSDTIFTDQSLTPGGTNDNPAALIIRPDYTLNQGQKFLVSAHFYGDTTNNFFFLFGWTDICGQTCLAESSIYEDNSIGRQINWQQGASVSGMFNNFFYPCNRTPPPQFAIPGNCELFYVQNIAMQAYVSIDVPFSATISQNVNDACPGVPLPNPISVNYFGETDPNTVTVEWSPITGLSSPYEASTDVTVDSTTTYTVTIIDPGVDTITRSITITTRGVNVNAGADRQVACGDTVNLLAAFTYHPGGQAGATFEWSNGRLTIENKGISIPGTYCITVENNYNCTASDCVDVTLNNGQSVDFAASPLNIDGKICKDVPVTFTNTSAILTGWKWKWNFDNGDFSTSQNVSHIFIGVTTPANKDSVILTAVDSASSICTLTVVKVYEVDVCIGIEGSKNLENFVSIYPNPTEGLLNIDFKGINEKNGMLSVYDVHGKKVYGDVLDVAGDASKKIDLSKFAEGIYLVRIQLGSESLTKKLHVSR